VWEAGGVSRRALFRRAACRGGRCRNARGLCYTSRMAATDLIRRLEERLSGPSADAPGLPPEQQLARLISRTEQVVTPEDLLRKLKKGSLKVKLGIDPTATMIHVGHYIAIRKLRQFQRLGHTVQLVIGSFTAMIGDTSDKTSARPALTAKEVEDNMRTYLDQVGRYLDLEKAEVRKNGEWFFKMKLESFLPLMMQMTIQQMLDRETFKLRYEKGSPIGLHEATYPLLQGYDSVMLDCDVEIGGTDQLFNMLKGRDLQPLFKQEAQVVMTLPLLIGTDGRKMSKSYGNVIALTDTPEDMYGKLLSVADADLGQYAKLLTDMHDEEWAELEAAMRGGLNPKEVKMLLARLIVGELQSRESALAAEKQWVERFSEGGVPSDLPEVKLTKAQKAGTIVDLLVSLGLSSSKSEARRLVEQGGVKELSGAEERKLDLEDISFRKGTHVYKAGKKNFVKVAS
jgi:tyrosyl-tRNA synthetase